MDEKTGETGPSASINVKINVTIDVDTAYQIRNGLMPHDSLEKNHELVSRMIRALSEEVHNIKEVKKTGLRVRINYEIYDVYNIEENAIVLQLVKMIYAFPIMNVNLFREKQNDSCAIGYANLDRLLCEAES